MASQAVTPNTPVVVKLLDHELCMFAGALAVVPTLSSRIKSIFQEKDPRDGVYRGQLTLNLTHQQFDAIISRAHGGRFDVRFYNMLRQFGLASDKDYEDLMSTVGDVLDPKPCIIMKSCGSGALAGLVMTGRADEEMHRMPGANQKAFAFEHDVSDRRYTIGTHTFMPSKETPERRMEFTVSRNGDMCNTLVLKVLLHPRNDGTVWTSAVLDKLYRNAQLMIGGNVMDGISVQANNALAMARGLWPRRNNTPPKDAKSPWLITVPLMFSESEYPTRCYLPMIAVHSHEVSVVVSNVLPEAEIAMDVDFVYLNTDMRRYVANGCGSQWQVPRVNPVAAAAADAQAPEEKPQAQKTRQSPEGNDWIPPMAWPAAADAQAPAEKPFAAPEPEPVPKPPAQQRPVSKAAYECEERKTAYASHDEITEYLSEDGQETKIRLPFIQPTSGIIISLATEGEVPDGVRDGVCPIVSAKIQLNRGDLIVSDFSDLTEFNWLKAGMPAPENSRTLLMPFSREMFPECDAVPIPACTIDMSRIDETMLVLVPNKNVSWMRWKATVTSYMCNVRRVWGGTGEKVYHM